eukprot:CAMPEP_0119502720 /NCGR_PEP_ID=MMETSP1344-20130328/24102_1 /TAXON_ID=236787 /ORGANISM="Florenciella parvula, Strain CCMP2471" /LENGTH=78 /DNA_ID=CAMNT_0007538951 /DNA_START=78 /DNA_END=311 /DNA_ORIENTATION=-
MARCVVGVARASEAPRSFSALLTSERIARSISAAVSTLAMLPLGDRGSPPSPFLGVHGLGVDPTPALPTAALSGSGMS